MNRGFSICLSIAMAMWISAVPARTDTLKTQTVTYEHEGTPLTGYLAYDGAIEGKRPAILVVHEWWGLNDYARMRAEALARSGYVAFAVDMYGAGKVTRHPEQAGQWAKTVTQNSSFWQQRARAGLEVLKQQPQTDPERMGAIGYCFGGGTVQQLAYSGADLKGVVSFHGSLQAPPSNGLEKIKAEILMAHGGDDTFMTPEQIQSYLSAMARSGLNYQFIIYSGAKHGFTNPDAEEYGLPALGYSRRADTRSWNHMKLFFEELFNGVNARRGRS
jgi:dienelactone hydrolase